MTRQSVSSPLATGGAGPFFEQHVAAYWLAQLLVRGIPPIFIETKVVEVHLQTERLGWSTDDFLVVCEHSGGETSKLVGQVKRSFTVSSSNDECKKSIQDFWKDFNNTDNFSADHDRFMLVIQRGSNTLLEHFAGLLDCARAARNGEEFSDRLNKVGFISSKSMHYCREIGQIISEIEGNSIEITDLWPFLRLLHVLSLDLKTSTRQTEAQIKNLLTHTTSENAAFGNADASWNKLLVVASTAMDEAQSLRRADLPKELQDGHKALGSNEQRILRALKDHTVPVLRNIRPTIGSGFHLQRAVLVQKVLDELENVQVVLVSGPAGSGKSVIGKSTVELLSQDHFVFGFRVEEFAKAHIDETLHVVHHQANAVTLSAILAGQGRKVVLIESVERLLEKYTRDAFSDLMNLAKADRSLGIILTCRNYSTTQVCTSFLQPAAIIYSIVSVPLLNDSELAEVETALPALVPPLGNPALRNILRNPYFLDKALEISWSLERAFPESEREFRALFWRQIVRAGQGPVPGMDRRRAEVFQDIAVRRARALSPYVHSKGMDPVVLEALSQDSLVVFSDENPLLITIAHDVLEDWAILQWLEEQHLTDDGSFQALSNAIGPHPAIRRTYRKWIAELIQRDQAAADRLFQAAITETEINAQFRDDTLISLLMGPSSLDFLTRNEAQILNQENGIFKRLLHLLRVGCMAPPPWFNGETGFGSNFNVPAGSAWTTILKMTYTHIEKFTEQERALLLRLIEDAVRNVNWRTPKLEGGEYVAGIAHWLLQGFDSYHFNEPRQRVLKVIAKLPLADTTRFETILLGVAHPQHHRDPIADEFREILFAGLDGMAAARDLPDLIVSVAKNYLLTTEGDLQREKLYRSSREIETCFGIKMLRSVFFPESAFRGPWFTLLQEHPRTALDFYFFVFNHSAEWYAHPRIPDPLEPAWEIVLTFADRTTRKQWCNPRLWNLYRGTSVGPCVLKSLLMALEKWLLDLAGAFPEQLDPILFEILRRSDSVMLTAIVASVAVAHPHASGEALLVLLSAPDCIRLDRARTMSEYNTSSLLAISSLGNQPEHRIYAIERSEANNLPHRKNDLENAIINLQLGPFAPRVQAIFDQYLAALPLPSEQSESHRLWRLALHRMDWRQREVSVTNDARKLGTETATAKTNNYYVAKPKALEPDLQEFVDASVMEAKKESVFINVRLWGQNGFERKDNHNSQLWRDMLSTAQTIHIQGNHDQWRECSGIVAAVCVRDHWEEMSANERTWCVEVVCSEIFRNADRWNPQDHIPRFPMPADNPCAAVVALLVNKKLDEPYAQNVRQAFATALTHPFDDVRWHITRGIDKLFWVTNPVLATHCVNVIATEASLNEHAWKVEKKRSYAQRRGIHAIKGESACSIRQKFWLTGGIANDAHSTINMSEWFGAEAICKILSILLHVPETPLAVTLFTPISHTLVSWWNAAGNRNTKVEHDSHIEFEIANLLERFVMRTSLVSAKQVLQPLLDVIDRHPNKIFSMIDGLTSIEDSAPNTDHYWQLWLLFAEGVKRASWVNRLNGRHPWGGEMVSSIFLTKYWKDGVRHWKSLEGHAHHVHALFEALPPSSIVLDNYMRFLYHIGEQSLPEAFVRIARALEGEDSLSMLEKENTVFLLEILLQRYVYGMPLRLKRARTLWQAVLSLLDILVDNGSSAAFRMRDDFVTPAM